MVKVNPNDIVIYPTDTVWGIGCRLSSEINFNQIAKIKKTPPGKPLSIMFDSVSELKKYFHFPDHFSDDWLNLFFTLETSLGIPRSWLRTEMPEWVYGSSDIISVRCLDISIIKKIYRDLEGPFFSTSLNLSGEPPITELNAARKFLLEHAQQCVLVEDDKFKNLSGVSSTMVFFEESSLYKIIRKGDRYLEVQKHLDSKFISA